MRYLILQARRPLLLKYRSTIKCTINKGFTPQRQASLPSRKNLNLDGRIALVTGGTTGIGLAIGRRLAENGAKVVLSSRKQNNIDAAVDELKAGGLQVSE